MTCIGKTNFTMTVPFSLDGSHLVALVNKLFFVAFESQ